MSHVNEHPHDAVKVGEAQLVVTVGLDEDGDEIVTEEWTNLRDPDSNVPEFTKHGVIGFLQTSRAFDTVRENWGFDE